MRLTARSRLPSGVDARLPAPAYRRRGRIVLVAGLVLAALPAAPAPAVTIGQTGAGPATACVGQWVNADTHYVVPAGGGTITSFSFEVTALNAGGQLDFLVLRPASTAGDYTVVGKTGLVTLQAGAGVQTFPADIPVQGGDILAFWHGANLIGCFRELSDGGFVAMRQATDPSVGAALTVGDIGRFFDLNLSANLVTGPTGKADCKNGGWRDFGDMFKNQGQCVTLFDDGGNAPASLPSRGLKR